MKKIAQYALLGAGLILFFYFCTVFVLFTVPLAFSSSIDNVWQTAIPTTVVALILLLAQYIWEKRRK
ncbi:MAG: hypothetical protein FWG30_10905 [Eubacteriaceae bacterium]|nr:hypothetical protein [Eubacteriaceae bacterium]